MSSLAAIAKHYRADFERDYGHSLQVTHHRALDQIIGCHTPQAGAMLYHCEPAGWRRPSMEKKDRVVFV